MALLIDPARWPAHGRLWSHLVSDTSYDELHRFAAAAGLPRRSYEGDHYDVPAERFDAVVAAGARPVEGRELVRVLQGSGLRLPKRKGERVLATWADARWLDGEPTHRVDCLASPLPPPAATTVATVEIVVVADRVLVSGDTLPPSGGGVACGYLRGRFDGSSRRVHVAATTPGAYRTPTPDESWLPVAALGRSVALRYWQPLVVHLQTPPHP